MSEIQHYFRRLFLDNFFLKAGSFILAFILWIYVQNQGKIEQRLDVKVTLSAFKGLPANTDIRLYRTSSDVVSLKLRGIPSAMAHIDRHCRLVVDIPPVFDEWGIDASIELKNKNFQDLPLAAEILSISPTTLSFFLDYHDQKEVDVEINLIGAHPLEGYMVSGQQVTPKRVILSGPRSIIEHQTSILTELTPISRNKVDYIKRVALILPAKEVTCSPEWVEIEFKISEIINTREFSNLPMSTKTVPGTDSHVIYDPQLVNVSIAGPHNDMKQLKRENIRLKLDVLELPADGKWRSIVPTLEILPDNNTRLKAVKFEPEKVKVKVSTKHGSEP